VALKILEHAGSTDVGRQRHTNEDSLVCSPPYFAVADGMGGAKAGEVASQVAIDAFEEPSDEGRSAEEQLADMLRDANRRIYELATSDESRRGMGTTLTAAKVHDHEVSLAHVGDSRAYRFRDGDLEQLTKDHSLVAELERTGQISQEAAEHHPQRSIITRALGPEPDVEVDTCTVAGRPGDIFLLCSDGLTSMISDDEAASILQGSEDLDEAADALVRAANQSGGKDNITVVLFRLGGDDGEADDAGAPAPDETVAGAIGAAEVEAARSPTPMPARPRRPAPAAPRPRRRPRARTVLGALLAVALACAAVAGLYAGSRQVYFVGTNDAGLVTLYRGVPYELPFGIQLYEEEYASGVPARAIPRTRRSRVLDHEWRGREDATDLVRQLEQGRLDTGGAAG
jgi:PPM family protein phosphatase